MSKIGLIARADQTGLAVQTLEVARHLHPTTTLVVNVDHLSPKNLVTQPERFIPYTDALMVSEGFPDYQTVCAFLDSGIDSLYTAETSYSRIVFDEANQRGIYSVLHVNPEFLDHLVDPVLPRPSLFACPTSWRYDEVPDLKTLLPFPVATDRFDPRAPRTEGRVHFLHVIGYPAVHDRNGTKDLMAALRFVSRPMKLTVKCLDAHYLSDLTRFENEHVEVVLDSNEAENYWDLYRSDDYDVLVLPRRYGGLCLPMQEALAQAMPVIMPAISPNDTLLPPLWLTPASHYGKFQTRLMIDLYATPARDLAAKMDQFTDLDFLAAQREHALLLGLALSWGSLKTRYREVFSGHETKELI